MDKALKQYTAFTMGNLGFFECECMPFGLCNAPATFQRLMQHCLGELNLTCCLIYLDDVIVFLKTEVITLTLPVYCVWVLPESTIWSSSWPSVSSSRVRLTIWLIMSPRKVYDPVKRTSKLWWNSLHHEPILKSEPFWPWWDITDDSLKGLLVLHNHCMSIFFWRRGQQDEWASDAHGKYIGCLWDSQ